MHNFYCSVFLLIIVSLTSACSSNDFYRENNNTTSLAPSYGYGFLPDLSLINTNGLFKRCQTQTMTNSLDIALTLHCTTALLSRQDITDKQKRTVLEKYNNATSILFSHRDKSDNLIQVKYTGPSNIFLVDDMSPTDERLSPKIFGEIGVAAVGRETNQREDGTSIDDNYPLEGRFSALSIYPTNISLSGLRIHIELTAKPVSNAQHILMGSQQYALRYSPSAAYLALLQNADIHNFSWLGFTTPQEAESRMGVFSIGPLSADKTPIIMTHGLNSDPLIWRHLTMAILNTPSLYSRYQIWHVYYPSGPPPFYNAMRVRTKLRNLKLRLEMETGNTFEDAVFIGHSMGGIISKLLTTHSDQKLWDATFTAPPDELLGSEDATLADVFLFTPVFYNNTVFFLDTPHRGSDVANSIIGTIGSALISLPYNFKTLFKQFIDKVGVDRLTVAMLPFLQNYGPDSVQVLRPNHPLMNALDTISVQGESYSIIGSTGALTCSGSIQCNAISDSVVSYASAYIADAKETRIVRSSHNSFQNYTAIEFIVNKLSKRH